MHGNDARRRARLMALCFACFVVAVVSKWRLSAVENGFATVSETVAMAVDSTV